MYFTNPNNQTLPIHAFFGDTLVLFTNYKDLLLVNQCKGDSLLLARTDMYRFVLFLLHLNNSLKPKNIECFFKTEIFYKETVAANTTFTIYGADSSIYIETYKTLNEQIQTHTLIDIPLENFEEFVTTLQSLCLGMQP